MPLIAHDNWRLSAAAQFVVRNRAARLSHLARRSEAQPAPCAPGSAIWTRQKCLRINDEIRRRIANLTRESNGVSDTGECLAVRLDENLHILPGFRQPFEGFSHVLHSDAPRYHGRNVDSPLGYVVERPGKFVAGIGTDKSQRELLIERDRRLDQIGLHASPRHDDLSARRDIVDHRLNQARSTDAFECDGRPRATSRHRPYGVGDDIWCDTKFFPTCMWALHGGVDNDVRAHNRGQLSPLRREVSRYDGSVSVQFK